MASSTYRLTDFIHEVQARYIASTPNTFWSCGSALQQLISAGVVQDWLNDQLQALAKDPHHVGNWNAQQATLHKEAAWSLSVALFDTQRRFIHALPFQAFYVPLKYELTGKLFQLPPGFRNDVFDPSLSLTAAGDVKVDPLELLKLETERYAYDFLVPRPIPVLRFATASLRPLEWLFSKTSLQAWQANDADLSLTQLRIGAFVLGKIAHQSSVAPLRRLASHPHHAVRWAAIQNLGRLSRSEALIKIREAVNDQHPHVRRAAQKTLDQLDKPKQR